MRKANPATTTIEELRATLATPSPDATLIGACDRLVVLREEVSQLCRSQVRGYLHRVRATMAERDQLEATIAATPARTVLGRLAKAEVALGILSESGSCGATAMSAIRDFMSADGALSREDARQ